MLIKVVNLVIILARKYSMHCILYNISKQAERGPLRLYCYTVAQAQNREESYSPCHEFALITPPH